MGSVPTLPTLTLLFKSAKLLGNCLDLVWITIVVKNIIFNTIYAPGVLLKYL